jgi:hypothetical protein
MNGTTTANPGRSVQLAVMAAPSASVAEAVAEARRRHDSPGARTILPARAPALRTHAVAAVG